MAINEKFVQDAVWLELPEPEAKLFVALFNFYIEKYGFISINTLVNDDHLFGWHCQLKMDYNIPDTLDIGWDKPITLEDWFLRIYDYYGEGKDGFSVNPSYYPMRKN